jgi:hypothetical protein
MSEEASGGWQAVVDQRLLQACERHTRQSRAMSYLPLPTSSIRPLKTHLEPAAWGIGFLEVHDREIPPALSFDLQQRVPQALLRDLHRPEYPERMITFETIEGTGDRQGRESWELARAARTIPPRPTLEPAVRTMRALALMRRELLAESWHRMIRPAGDQESGNGQTGGG